MNQLIISYLSSYLNNPDPQYAVMLKGKWGCGKTYFIKKWLEDVKVKEANNENIITLKPIYVSAYGMTTIADMKVALDREINPFFYSSTGKFIMNSAKILGKIAFKTSFDIDGNGKDETSFSASLDSFALFKSDSESIRGTKLLVFDDIERCQINMKQLLGYINGFVEHCKCHVVVIGDEEHIEGDSKSAFDEFKEKTIGREFEIQPDIEGAIDYFLSEVPVCDYLRSQRDYIIHCFKSSGYNNLRILRQCLYDFNEQLSLIDEVKYQADNPFLHNILGSFIAVYYEYADKDNNPIISNWATAFQMAQLSKDENIEKKFHQIKEKYNAVSQGCLYHVLGSEYVSHVVQHIKTGKHLDSFFNEHISSKPKEVMPWERLYHYYNLSNDEFEDAYQQSMQAISQGNVINNYQLGTTIAYFSYFHIKGIHDFANGDIMLSQQEIQKRIENAKTLNELYQLRTSFIQGCNYIHDERPENDPLQHIILFFNQKFQEKSRKLPDDMQRLLRNLTDKNVGDLYETDQKSYPDRSSAYELRAIFANEDAEQLFESLKAMSNSGRNDFAIFLSEHYKFNYKFNKGESRFADDIPVLTSLKELVDSEIKDSESVDKYTYNVLSQTLERAIQRANGAELV